jgi:hypothetical protein
MAHESIAVAIMGAAFLYLSAVESYKEQWRFFFMLFGFLNGALAVMFAVNTNVGFKAIAVLMYIFSFVYVLFMHLIGAITDIYQKSR